MKALMESYLKFLDEDAIERFWSKVEIRAPTECWPWKAGKFSNGYGNFAANGLKGLRAHRIAYNLAFGRIPQELNLDHLCRNRACVNPTHLQLVTPRENTLRGNGPTARNIMKQTCPQGHPYSGDNLYITHNGKRMCKECARQRARLSYWEEKTH